MHNVEISKPDWPPKVIEVGPEDNWQIVQVEGNIFTRDDV